MLIGCNGGGSSSTGTSGSGGGGGGSGGSDTPADPSRNQAAGATIPGWPDYIAMGAVGGPNIDPSNINVGAGGDDCFGGAPVDAVFKYAGTNGNGDPGVIDPPTNALRMTADMNNVSKANQYPSRVIIVEYTGQMSGGQNYDDFTNTSTPSTKTAGATYMMARHFISLGADAKALADKPVVYNGSNYYGALIMDPDLLGEIQQNNLIGGVNSILTGGVVNTCS